MVETIYDCPEGYVYLINMGYGFQYSKESYVVETFEEVELAFFKCRFKNTGDRIGISLPILRSKIELERNYPALYIYECASNILKCWYQERGNEVSGEGRWQRIKSLAGPDPINGVTNE